jgi:hypothetical protein
VSQQVQDFAFGDATTDVRGKLVAAKRLAEAELGAQVITGWLCFCDAAWFDAFVGHATVIDSFRYQEGQTIAPTCARPASPSPASPSWSTAAR